MLPVIYINVWHWPCVLLWKQLCCLINESKEQTGLPWWSSGYKSACQYRGHRFDPWSGEIPREWQEAKGQRSPSTTAAEPALQSRPRATPEARALEPALYNHRSHRGEKPVCRDWRNPVVSNEDPAHPGIKWIKKEQIKVAVGLPW